MALDKDLRDALRVAVQKARETLTQDLLEILEGVYGIHRAGAFEAPASLPAVQTDPRAREIRDLLLRVLPPAPTTSAATLRFQEGFDAVVRSLAFTHLNRLVAFKMMEDASRKIIREAVGRGPESNGFKFYLAEYPEDEARWKGGEAELAYQHFLLWLSGERHREIGVLFDPDDLASRVFPRPRALAAVLGLINDAALAPVWSHEETLGWVYQYYTPKELREQARKASAAPRNSYELAFRNQFYTPDYVVRFLTDNTLGRLWFEMKPDTTLRVRCTYLVIRPDETPAPRPKKDPREIRVLDPASGSGHFLLYAFELFEAIYREAYDDPDLGPPLRKDFPDRAAYEREAPRLIVEHNLHGIDIDRRATQIAALTLFLKARTRSRDVRIERSHVVCAEPMPGNRALLEEFKARKLKNGQGVVGRLLDGIWGHLQLAGEAGSLLKAEEETGRLIADEHRRWREDQARGATQEMLIPELAKPEQQRLDFSDVTDEEFWATVEGTVERRLQEFAEEATGAEGAHRRMFARDGIQGLRFLDLLSQRYDVVLMNPPFGAPSLPSKAYVDRTYPRTKNDVYAAFVERWLDRLHARGRLGAITSRTGFFLKSFARWREEVLLGRTRIDVVADLGYGVLDTAMVETAAYVLEAKEGDPVPAL